MNTYTFDAMITIEASGTQEEAADEILQFASDGGLAVSLHTEGTLNVKALQDKLGAAEERLAQMTENLGKSAELYAQSQSRLDSLQKEHEALIHDHERVMQFENENLNAVVGMEMQRDDALRRLASLSTAAIELLGLMAEAKRVSNGRDGDETDRVFAWYEFDALRAALCTCNGEDGMHSFGCPSSRQQMERLVERQLPETKET